jgi:hypothetical protein
MARMTKFDHSTRLLARQALREAVRQWPLGEGPGPAADEVARAQEERISREIEAEHPEEPPRAASRGSVERLRRAPSFARLLLGALAMVFGVGLAWAATARLRRA